MSFKLGKISDLANPFTVAVFFLQFFLIIGYFSYKYYMDSSESCIQCHGSKKKMIELGYPQFYITLKDVRKQTKHKTVFCRDCHLGNGRTNDKEKAHKGMLKPLYVNHSMDLVERKELYEKNDYELNRLIPQGDDELFNMIPKIKENGELYLHPEVRNLLWHDRNPESFNFDFEIAKKTCGKRGCHAEELKQFRTTIMGRNFRQRTMVSWLEPYGPHNCGPSFADIPPEKVLKKVGFDFTNTEKIRKEMNISFTNEQAMRKQKMCNVCHPGCLDCHYAPSRKRGSHAFLKVPDSYSCMGRGRSNSICHSGAGQSRRGETYIGNFYSIPQGRKGDIHFKKGIQCIDCHQIGEKGMGDIKRKATCQDCHIEIEKAHAKSIHKNLTCTACHVTEAGGYQITIWGKGYIGEKPTPFKKYGLYYGIQKPLILMKDQKGIWFPVKIFPHSVENIKKDVPPSGLRYRWPNGETRDMYYIIGTIDGLPSGNKHLLWIQIEEVSHPFGKARDCESCHRDKQISISQWEYEDIQGAEPFRGGYKIVADENGLKIKDFWHTKINVLPGFKLTDFASWIYFTDKWFIPGNFSIKVNKNKYISYLKLYKSKLNYLKRLEKKIKNKKEKEKFKEIKGILIHNPELNIKNVIEKLMK
ncbi:MAG: Cytochrome c553 [Thermodesulfobacteria bacterium]|nr:cytochrome c3 family protein [Thermodesulfobacteriota bacterium]MCU4137360.1 Cytochrome c553 [Thermodesulfobacteriota bacterium]